MPYVNTEILMDIITDHDLCQTQKNELIKVIDKLTPHQIKYKQGFGYCTCGNEFELEGYRGEEYCMECGQLVWIGGYKGKVDNVIKFNKKD